MQERWILLVFCLFLLLLPTRAEERVIFEGSMEDVYLQILPAQKGRSVSSVADPGVLAKTNGTFFQIYRGIYYPIGRVISWGKEMPSTPGPKGQWWIIQDTRTRISKDPPVDPSSCICAIKGAPVIIKDGKVAVSTKGLRRNAKEFVRRNCTRNVVAITRNGKLRIYRSKGSLRSIARYLVKQDIIDALNLDGGSSTRKGQPVANIVLVCKKTRPCYAVFKREHLKKKTSKDWPLVIRKNSFLAPRIGLD